MRMLAVVCLLLLGCGDYGPGSGGRTELKHTGPAPMTLSSPAFKHGETIPNRYACTTRDLTPPSPPLEWTNVPESTQSLALVLHDADASRKTFVYWVALNIPAATRYLPEAAGNRGADAGSGFGGYFGVIPHKDRPHRYVFTLYALDTELHPPSLPTSPVELEQAAAGHILAKAELGCFSSPSRLSIPKFW